MVTLDARDLDAAPAEPSIRRYTPDDLAWATELLAAGNGRLRIRRGEVVDVAVLPGLVTAIGDRPTGIVTVQRHRDELEIAAIDGIAADPGAIRRLIRAAISRIDPTISRVWTVTTNAEFDLQRVLQMEGFRLCSVRVGAIEATRARLSPTGLPHAVDGVPVRDEVEFDLLPA